MFIYLFVFVSYMVDKKKKKKKKEENDINICDLFEYEICLLILIFNNFDFEDLRKCERKEGDKRDGDYFEIQVPFNIKFWLLLFVVYGLINCRVIQLVIFADELANEC